MKDLISRRAAMNKKVLLEDWTGKEYEAILVDDIKHLPSAQPTLCGYDIEHLMLIANVLRKENLSPERVTDALTDIGRIVSMVIDEFEETLRKAVEQCKI